MAGGEASPCPSAWHLWVLSREGPARLVGQDSAGLLKQEHAELSLVGRSHQVGA